MSKIALPFLCLLFFRNVPTKLKVIFYGSNLLINIAMITTFIRPYSGPLSEYACLGSQYLCHFFLCWSSFSGWLRSSFVLKLIGFEQPIGIELCIFRWLYIFCWRLMENVPEDFALAYVLVVNTFWSLYLFAISLLLNTRTPGFFYCIGEDTVSYQNWLPRLLFSLQGAVYLLTSIHIGW